MDILELLKLYLEASEDVKKQFNEAVGFQEQSFAAPPEHQETP